MRFPCKWMSLEALETLKFTTYSDVWSFGILLYEMFSLGDDPYTFVEAGRIIDFLRDGKRLEMPNYCSDEMFVPPPPS